MRKVILLSAAVLLLGCSEEKSKIFDLVITNVNVIDLSNGQIEAKTLFIHKGRIEKVVISSDSLMYEAERKVVGEGKYALPGFWDNHVHFRGGDSLIEANKNFLKLFIANGITTVRDAGGDLTPAIMEWKSAIEKETLLGPTIFTSGPKLDGPNATWAGSLFVEDEDDIQKALDSLENIPTDYVKLYDSQISAEAYLKTIEAAEKRGLLASGHMPFTVNLHDALQVGIDGIEHLYYIMKGCSAMEAEITQKLQKKEIGFWEAMPALQATYNDSVAQHTFAIMKERNVFSIPTLYIGKVLSYLDEENHSNDSYLKYMGSAVIKTYEGRINRVKNSTSEAIQSRKELDTFFGKLAKTMSDMGVPMLAGSDSGAYNSYTYPGISLHQELETMVAVGIAPLKALQYSAYNGSKFLKQEADYGSLSEGKVADIVVLDGNPLDDISQTKNIDFVIKGSQILTKEDLQTLLDTAVNTN
jgi:imidazolonepropionase-like amidohydrolase